MWTAQKLCGGGRGKRVDGDARSGDVTLWRRNFQGFDLIFKVTLNHASSDLLPWSSTGGKEQVKPKKIGVFSLQDAGSGLRLVYISADHLSAAEKSHFGIVYVVCTSCQPPLDLGKGHSGKGRQAS